MKLKVIIPVLIVCAGLIYLASIMLNENEQHMSDAPGADEMTNEEGSSLRDLIAQSGSHVCTVHEETGSDYMNGTVYVANGMIRGDYESHLEAFGNMTVQSSLIIRDGSVYTWNSILDSGMVTPVNPEPTNDTSDPSFGYDLKLAYECVEGEADPALFELPTEIQFKTLEELQQGQLDAWEVPADMVEVPAV